MAEDKDDIEGLREKLVRKLEKASRMSRKEAETELLREVEKLASKRAASIIREKVVKAEEEPERRAAEILVNAMRHAVHDYVSEYTVSEVKIDEDLKGRIIGKEGRNIRAFERAAKVDVDLEEEGVVRLSSFDPVRREVARVALEKLIKDGRIQPARIEEMVGQSVKEIEKVIRETGEYLVNEAGVFNLPPEIIKTLGKFKFRFSYGQNMVVHTLEETKIGVAIAHEVGVKVSVVRLGCLLHDIGKVLVDREGSHVEKAVSYLKKFGIGEEVLATVAQHHEDEPFTSVESLIVYMADSISGSRPGARYEDYDKYVKRMEELEGIARGFEGVAEAWVFQAGRELRVLVDPKRISDDEAVLLAEKMAEEIEKKIEEFPGQIKVTVIREFRASETAM